MNLNRKVYIDYILKLIIFRLNVLYLVSYILYHLDQDSQDPNTEQMYFVWSTHSVTEKVL